MDSKNDPFPRDLRDHLLEVTAACETTTALALALAAQSINPDLLLSDFSQLAKHLMARAQGESHPDRYLELLQDQLQRRLAALKETLRQ